MSMYNRQNQREQSIEAISQQSGSESEHQTSRPTQQRFKLRGKRSRRNNRNNNAEIHNYIDGKICEICNGQQNEQQLLLCDRCDDSYHTYCLNPPLQQLPNTQWICQICKNQLEQKQKLKIIQLQNKVQQIQCYLCHQSLEIKSIINGIGKKNKSIEIILNKNNIRCLYCKHLYHYHCFSQRKNSLNCWSCQKQIRKKGPKSHDDFMKFILQCLQSVNQINCPFKMISNIEQQQESKQRYRWFRLKVPCYMTTWQSITENQASIYYAFKTKGLIFIDNQLYEKENYDQMMKYNNPKRDISKSIKYLHERDEKVYEQFKINAEKGYVGPLQVKEDRVKGFYLSATQFIQPYTIISEYIGEVKTARIAVNYEQNDSIFLLIRSARSSQSLDIVPQKYGINNEYKKIHGISKLQNVKSMRFTYKGRVRLLLYTCKPIQSGQILYFNYNGSAFHQYPTEHFVL